MAIIIIRAIISRHILDNRKNSKTAMSIIFRFLKEEQNILTTLKNQKNTEHCHRN